MNTFWTVYIYPAPKGTRIPRRPFKKHHAALAKAYELGRAHPGKSVYVMESKQEIKFEVVCQ